MSTEGLEVNKLIISWIPHQKEVSTMSTFLLYHVFGLKGVKDISIKYINGTIIYLFTDLPIAPYVVVLDSLSFSKQAVFLSIFALYSNQMGSQWIWENEKGSQNNISLPLEHRKKIDFLLFKMRHDVFNFF